MEGHTELGVDVDCFSFCHTGCTKRESGLGGSTACLRAEVHKDGQKVKGKGKLFGQVRAQLLEGVPWSPGIDRK